MKACCSNFILYYGLIFGILDWLTDLAYYSQTSFVSAALENACLAFVIFQPIWYLFVFMAYIGSNTDIDNLKERMKKMLFAPFYAIL